MKRIFTFLGMVAMGATAYGQADTDIVHIPDANFKKALLGYPIKIDKNGDKEISYGEAREYTGTIAIASKNISSLVGIEAFVNITHLYCNDNQLTGLDVSKNTSLKFLYCHGNQLTNLDLSKNIVLTDLSCLKNQLTSLDLSKNTALQYLSCHDNQLTSLDLSKNTELKGLVIHNNQLTQLNLANGNNSKFRSLYIRGNPNLQCIQIDKGFSPQNNWYINTDGNHIFSDDCNYPTLSTTEAEVEVEQPIQILNPVKDNIIIKNIAKVEKIEMYNMAGRLVKILFRGNTIVQDLAKGVYIVKITTDKGVITEKIIKE